MVFISRLHLLAAFWSSLQNHSNTLNLMFYLNLIFFTFHRNNFAYHTYIRILQVNSSTGVLRFNLHSQEQRF